MGLICLLPFPSWQSLVSLVTSATVIMYAFAPITLLALRKADPDRPRPYRLPMASILAPAAFIASNEIINWSSWDIVSGGVCDAEAAWRGAFLACGSLTEAGRSPSLVIISPGPEAALALLGAARKLGVTAKTREVHGADGVVVREGNAIAALLTRLGAPCSALAWQQHRMRRQAPTTTNQPIVFGDANHRRTTQAAAEATARVQRALQVLGPDIPEHLLLVGRLRLDHPQASLDELGRLADPPMTKDAIAGRIRRLLALADNHTHHLQVPDTTTCVVTPDMPDSRRVMP